MTFGSLFAGIGGMDLGLEWAGLRCRWQVERDAWRRERLALYWPNARRHDDVSTFLPDEKEDWDVDLIAGGFPCQDISNAGRRAGIDGERSGLWREFARIIRVVRPRYVLVENAAALTVRGLGRVLGDLAESGFDAEWDCLPAAAFGADHIRDRIFILAHSNQERPALRGLGEDAPGEGSGRGDRRGRGGRDPRKERLGRSGQSPSILPHAESRLARQLRRVEREGRREAAGHLCWPQGESGVSRTADGVPDRLHRNASLGDAVCPPIACWLGRRFIEYHRRVGCHR